MIRNPYFQVKLLFDRLKPITGEFSRLITLLTARLTSSFLICIKQEKHTPETQLFTFFSGNKNIWFISKWSILILCVVLKQTNKTPTIL